MLPSLASKLLYLTGHGFGIQCHITGHFPTVDDLKASTGSLSYNDVPKQKAILVFQVNSSGLQWRQTLEDPGISNDPVLLKYATDVICDKS